MVIYMENQNIYHDIAQRTGGDIYIGVVGPVRTGKSTFIKKFMETLVIPNMSSDFMRERCLLYTSYKISKKKGCAGCPSRGTCHGEGEV